MVRKVTGDVKEAIATIRANRLMYFERVAMSDMLHDFFNAAWLRYLDETMYSFIVLLLEAQKSLETAFQFYSVCRGRRSSRSD